MTDSHAQVVICGAGIAGIATAYFLAVKSNVQNVVLLERDTPLAMTSDKSTECYRNWWGGIDNAMVGLMNRSIDWLEVIANETNNQIHLNRRGYVYATSDSNQIPKMREAAEIAERNGAGILRIHDSSSSNYTPSSPHGFTDGLDGTDLILEPEMIRKHFPELDENVIAVLHARRCGWFSAQQLGMYLLEKAKEHGVRYIRGEVTGVNVLEGAVEGVQVTRDGEAFRISTPTFVNAAGPLQNQVAKLLGLNLPIINERHAKLYFNDHLGIIPRNAPMLINLDVVHLPWSSEEREVLESDESTRWLLGSFGSGAHCRPEGGDSSSNVLILCNYHTEPTEPSFPIIHDPEAPEIALRAMSVLVPGLKRYFDHTPKPVMDGGYYTKTRENRPLIGELSVEGAYIIGAMGGFGLMAACGAGELLTAHITKAPLPDYARAFLPSRYEDPEYLRLLETWGDVGQL
jgi:sarcosine oxidase, subunit beta